MNGNIDQTLENSLHGLLNFVIGALDCRIYTTKYKCMSIVYTCITYFVMHFSMLFIAQFLVKIRTKNVNISCVISSLY